MAMATETIGVVRELVRDAVGCSDSKSLLDVVHQLEETLKEHAIAGEAFTNGEVIEFSATIAGKKLDFECEFTYSMACWTVYHGFASLSNAFNMTTAGLIRLLKSL